MDRKTENIINFVENMSKNINEYKGSQAASGKSFINYQTNSSNSYDFALTMDSLNKTFRITFTHELSDKYNIVDLSWFMRVDNSNVMASPYLSNTIPYTTQVCYEMPQLGTTTWLLDCNNSDFTTFPSVDTHTFYFKFYFNGTTTGTFSAVAL